MTANVALGGKHDMGTVEIPHKIKLPEKNSRAALCYAKKASSTTTEGERTHMGGIEMVTDF
ncbi:MAG TPA: hypothetical protein VK550_25080 [Polyangiaceae bacterium]|nr:hypothetical protein [Polyangiaceae bacterium]